MDRRILRPIILLTMLHLAACQTTDDPRQGGLFSYNPQAYDQRLADRQAQLANVERQTAAEQQRSRELEAERDQKQATRDALVRDVATLDKDIAQAETALQAFKGKTTEAENKRWQLSVQLKSVKQQLTEVKAKQDSAVESKQQEVERLRRTLDRLLAEAETLSKM